LGWSSSGNIWLDGRLLRGQVALIGYEPKSERRRPKRAAEIACEMRVIVEASGMSVLGEIATVDDLGDGCTQPLPDAVAAKGEPYFLREQMLEVRGR
jgi:hypothetical protein